LVEVQATPASVTPASVPASVPPAVQSPLVVLQVKPEGQLLAVHFALHWRVAELQMLLPTAAAQSASVLQVQKLAAELAIFAQVFSDDGQSVEPEHVATHVLRIG